MIRDGASEVLRKFAEEKQIPVVNSFMAKGVLPSDHPLSLFYSRDASKGLCFMRI
ncbi:hypothetical protein RCO48_15845 [Peribacillus frigoritolerans]|nr:hypothetical protein [Peribacillus frigoritolerans]